MCFPARVPHRICVAVIFCLVTLPVWQSAQALDFSGISPAETVAESRARADERRTRVLEFYADMELPANNDEGPKLGNNPRLDSRTDVRTLTDIIIARILLGLPIGEAEEIILDERTDAFAIPGSSNEKSDPGAICHRNGDYDFAMINWLRLANVARAHPGTLSDAAYEVIVKKLLTVSGNEHTKTFRLECLGIPIHLQDTENHILMLETSKYLTNQLLSELPENDGNEAFDNEKNGNNAWMLEYLATFMREMFDEYNSRPYQGYTVLALKVLHSYAADERVSLAAGMLLDLISAWSAVQSNQLRRFGPFRRQPEYILPETIESKHGWQSWGGDGETPRLTLVVGNYGYLENYGYEMPQPPELSRFAMTAVSPQYHMEDVLLDLAIREEGDLRYFIGRHDNVEIYSATKNALISAGGHFQEAAPPAVEGLPIIIRQIVEAIVKGMTDKQHGWGRPTTVTPSKEPSSDLRDMIRFEGHRDLKHVDNTCVGPGFACGLTPVLGNVVEPVAKECSVTQGDFRFFDFQDPDCPVDYGFFLALYEKSCDTDQCRDRSASDSYGLLEVGEGASSTFSEFKEAVLKSNPGPFGSSGVHTYVTKAGHEILFEIDPPEGRSSLVSIDGEKFDRDYSNWPTARGNVIQSTTPGRHTFDSPSLRERLIIDMTDPQEPRRFRTKLPTLRREPSQGGDEGRYFDDGGAVIPGKGIEWITLRSGDRLDGFSMGWRSGLEVSHGGSAGESRMTLEDDEYITEVGIGVVDVYDRQGVGRIRIRTSADRELAGGKASEQFTYTASPGEQIIAFHGRSGGEIDRLGVIFAPLSEDEPTDTDTRSGTDTGTDADTGLDTGHETPTDTGDDTLDTLFPTDTDPADTDMENTDIGRAVTDIDTTTDDMTSDPPDTETATNAFGGSDDDGEGGAGSCGCVATGVLCQTPPSLLLALRALL